MNFPNFGRNYATGIMKMCVFFSYSDVAVSREVHSYIPRFWEEPYEILLYSQLRALRKQKNGEHPCFLGRFFKSRARPPQFLNEERPPQREEEGDEHVALKKLRFRPLSFF